MKKLLLLVSLILISASAGKAECPKADSVKRALKDVLTTEKAKYVATMAGLSEADLMAASFADLNIVLKESGKSCHYHVDKNPEYFYEITMK